MSYRPSSSFGRFLRLAVYGASHAPCIGMRLENFPRGFAVDLAALQAFLERRAPGRDRLSTARREPDAPEFVSGLEDGVTTGGVLEAVIRNADVRKRDYDGVRVIPRPGHADFGQWVQTGRISTGGGEHSGRMTAALCVAGGICRQWLARRGVAVDARLAAAGGETANPDAAVAAAMADGDSVGGIIDVTVTGLRPGLGGALFGGVETELSSAMFAIPGVKGVEFGDGFALAAMRGSQANDPFIMADGAVATVSNRMGGLLGGITTGMPVVLRIAMKPTPSIFREQRSVNLSTMSDTVLEVRGRHDPCIARRAVPVAEAMAAFVFADMMMADEAARPRICLTLAGRTLDENLAALMDNAPFVDMCELRADFLDDEQLAHAADFPARAGMPVILTLRRKCDGGQWTESEDARAAVLAQALAGARTPFAFVDFEDDFRVAELERTARLRGTRIIRSLHDFNGPVTDIVAWARAMKGVSDDIPKLAFAVHSCAGMARLFRETADFDEFPHIVCAMGAMGQSSRILAGRTHSMLTFAAPRNGRGGLNGIGQLSPETLVRTYRFRQLAADTELYAVTGWPLGHTLSPELNNAAFFEEAWPAVMVPLPAESAAEVLDCADALGIRGIAVTVPHKKDMLPLMAELSPEARAVGAVNTVVRTADGWHGANTDVAGFRRALLDFLDCGDLAGRRVALLGAGGAANAVAYVIAQLGGTCCIFNRTLDKARALAAKYGFKAAPLAAESAELLGEYGEVIVQTTSVGLSSRAELGADADPIPFYRFRGTEALFDLIYSPAETPVMARARAAGCRAENGLNMLVEQAKEQRRLYKLLGSSMSYSGFETNR